MMVVSAIKSSILFIGTRDRLNRNIFLLDKCISGASATHRSGAGDVFNHKGKGFFSRDSHGLLFIHNGAICHPSLFLFQCSYLV